jgi:hypothetical protein
MKRFSLIINHTSEDSHSAVLSSWDVNKEGHKTNIEAQVKTHKDVFMALNSMMNFVNKRILPIDTTPPTPKNKGVIIPEKYSWVFKNNRFELNNFVVEFQTVDNELVIDTSYIFWEAFKTELDKPENITVKDSLMPVWDYIVQQIIIDNTIDL